MHLSRAMRWLGAIIVVGVLFPSCALAEDRSPEQLRYSQRSAFDRDFAVSIYALGMTGGYQGAGMGGRLRWEVLDWLGVEAYLELAWIDQSRADRYDIPNGFSLFVPIELSDRVRVLPKFGFCDVISFITPEDEHAEPAHDILFGLHAGAGLEWAMSNWVSGFVDVQMLGYTGHARYANDGNPYQPGWSQGVDNELSFWLLGQVNLGLNVHL